MKLKVGNLDDVQTGFALLEEGVYKFQCQAPTLKQKTGSTNPYAEVPIVVTQGPDPSKPEVIGRKGWIRLSTAENARWKLKEFCEATGISWDSEGVELDQCIGRELWVKVTQRSYTDSTGNPRVTNDFDEFVKG